MQQGIAKFKHGPPFFANLTIIANYICGISKAHFRLILLALHGVMGPTHLNLEYSQKKIGHALSFMTDHIPEL